MHMFYPSQNLVFFLKYFMALKGEKTKNNKRFSFFFLLSLMDRGGSQKERGRKGDLIFTKHLLHDTYWIIQEWHFS